MRESYRTCLSKTRRKLALSEGLAKHAAGGRTDYVSVVSDDVVSTVGSVVRGEFDCAAALSVHEEHFLAAVDAAAADAKKVMLLDLGSAWGRGGTVLAQCGSTLCESTSRAEAHACVGPVASTAHLIR